jgi:hypothetical protein
MLVDAARELKLEAGFIVERKAERKLEEQMRDSGLPADVLVGKLKKDIYFALRRGTIAQVTTHHALDGYAWLRLPSAPPRMRSSLPSTDGQAGWDR